MKRFVEDFVQGLRNQAGVELNLYKLLEESSRSVGLNGVWSICKILRAMNLLADGQNRLGADTSDLSVRGDHLEREAS